MERTKPTETLKEIEEILAKHGMFESNINVVSLLILPKLTDLYMSGYENAMDVAMGNIKNFTGGDDES